jgi:hypothetical protein
VKQINRVFFFGVLFFSIYAGAVLGQGHNDATIFHIYSSHTSFPDTGRAKGHTYDNVLYTAAGHYNDSTVLIVVPKNLNAKKRVDMVFWFHGWRNNVDNALVHYELSKQFLASNRNAVLVLAETARDAPDSYGGKLEDPGVFSALVADVLAGLKSKGLISPKCRAGHILLGGHSGAYRVMARIIKNGGEPVDEVMLFDALYAETDIFTDWVKADPSHRFINLFTDHGGTLDETHSMIKLLDDADINYLQLEEKDVVPGQYRSQRVLFIHSLKPHDEIVNPDNFRLMLENNPFLKPVKSQ